MALAGARKIIKFAPQPLCARKVLCVDAGKGNAHGAPAVKHIKGDIHAVVDFDRARILAAAPASAGGVVDGVVGEPCRRGVRMMLFGLLNTFGGIDGRGSRWSKWMPSALEA